MESKKRNLSDEEIEKKRLLKEARQSFLDSIVRQADELNPNAETKKREKEKESIRLGKGTTSIAERKALLIEAARPYDPMFPNTKPFFKLMYSLNGWHHLDPNDFIKPACVALWIKQYIYARFPKDILPSLMQMDNPIIYEYIRKYKLFQFLNDEGLKLLEGYIDDAISVMKESKNWYDFELKYTQRYHLSVQLKWFED